MAARKNGKKLFKHGKYGETGRGGRDEEVVDIHLCLQVRATRAGDLPQANAPGSAALAVDWSLARVMERRWNAAVPWPRGTERREGPTRDLGRGVVEGEATPGSGPGASEANGQDATFQRRAKAGEFCLSRKRT